jgi:hypothetical protein
MATDPVKQLSEQLLARIARLEFFISNLISSLSISRYSSYQADRDIRKGRVYSWFRRKSKVKDEWENVLSHFSDIELDNWRDILNRSPNDELILGLASDLAGIKNDIYDLHRSISSYIGAYRRSGKARPNGLRYNRSGSTPTLRRLRGTFQFVRMFP